MDKNAAKGDIDAALQYACRKMEVEKLKPEQEQGIRAFLGGSDVFISLPTGYGKSLCFALLPHLFDHLRGCASSRTCKSIVLCVVPLQSLMTDQYYRFKDSLSVAVVNGGYDTDVQKVFSGDVGLIYISPESLLSNSRYRAMLRSQVYQDNLVAFAVDEAHTVKTWSVRDANVYASACT